MRNRRLLECELVLERKSFSDFRVFAPRLIRTDRVQIIGIPDLVSSACLLVGRDALSETQVSNCTNIATRSFKLFDAERINGVGHLTGANALDVANKVRSASH